MRLINVIDSVGSKVNTLLTTHEETSLRLNNIEKCVTVHPANAKKQHGFAVVLRAKEEANGKYEVRFIAGQQAYVRRTLAKSPRHEQLVPFQLIGNGINRRNNFGQLATMRTTSQLKRSWSKQDICTVLWKYLSALSAKQIHLFLAVRIR